MINQYKKFKNIAIDFYHRQEPPDLEEIWMNFNKKIRSIFHINTNFSENHNKSYFIFIFLIILILWLISGFFIVQEGKVAVLTRFGKYIKTVQSGIHWKFPSPIDSYEIVNISRLRTLEIGYRGNSANKILPESLMLTNDENIVDMQFVVQYRLRNDGAPNYLFKISDPNNSVRQVAETAMREIVGKRNMDFVLYEGRTLVSLDVQNLMQHILDNYKTGIQIDTVAIQNVQPPEQVQAAFDDAVKAGQDRERKINEGYAYANHIIPLASGQASRLLEQAEGYKTKIIEEAKGNVSRFDSILKEYEKNPDITSSRIYLEGMEEIFSQNDKIIINSDNSTILIPNERINKKALNKYIQDKDDNKNLPKDNVAEDINSNYQNIVRNEQILSRNR
ncbi:Modulator of FtsH protease HflK [Candidatus Kinetoplastibacterium sorsogonicusi]|uniref:Protein HflK n=1 Tax=Candidatus Kinetoplastidibacterium kentomonadis TaxID=1576550 RepID=A0A3S7JA05_9PROT|nr:FtsH protease activity modulator HflK [Candidatus Kinetoplastibacterium sorsogonicusi]AWD32486.1 Modulator of FtsH protease HflK [Candidatus Kinetoplastibacterium sorsogonicusi]